MLKLLICLTLLAKLAPVELGPPSPVAAEVSSPREAARRCAAEALASGAKDPRRSEALWKQAVALDPTYDVASCRQGQAHERQRHFAEAAELFHTCLEHDPEQAFAHLGYAQNLLRARGAESYAEARAHFQQFLELAARDPIAGQDAASRRVAEGWVVDLEQLLVDQNPAPSKERLDAQHLSTILLRPDVRGPSRYDGPRVPLRLAFRPGDAELGAAAKEQLEEVAKALKDPHLADAPIQIEGHTDSREGGSREQRLALGRRRAETARDFLVRQGGISGRRLRIETYGDAYPLANNQDETGQALNRRVELLNLKERELILHDVRDAP